VKLDTLLQVLQNGQIEVQGLLPNGSNYTFFAMVSRGEMRTFAVYKPTRGEQPLWDFPEETLALREVAAYLTSEALGWNFVPPTVYRTEGPHGAGSLQYYVQAQPDCHYFTFSEAEKAELPRVALFDLLVNNADRKGGHILKDTQDKLWLIDHGICFNTQPKLRTVVWDFGGQAIPEPLIDDLAGLSTSEPGLALGLALLLRSAFLSPRKAANRRPGLALLALGLGASILGALVIRMYNGGGG